MMISYPMWKDWWGRSSTNPSPEAHAEDPETLRVCGQGSFLLTARRSQRPPPLAKDGGSDWRTWLLMGGRGAGKTRAGAEFVRFAALFEGARRIALVGPTFADVRNVMIEGESGLLSLEYGERPIWQPSRGRLVFSNGAEAFAYSAEDPDSLRGPQFDLAWCDEIGVWPRGEAVWDMLQLALRLGPAPRCIATTTPSPVPLVRRLVEDRTVHLTRSSTEENRKHLSPAFLAHVKRAYGGTKLGRQELDGELIDEVEGALWTRSLIDRCRRRVSDALDLSRTVVAVDPPAGKGASADACGIIAAGQAGPRAFVIADVTCHGLSPAGWARRAVELAERLHASEIVVEANQGGEMARHAIETTGTDIPVRLVRAIRDKRARAMPIAALYEEGRVAHAGLFPELEDEMCAFGGNGFSGSPDRLDAMVWAIWALLIDGRGEGRVRAL